MYKLRNSIRKDKNMLINYKLSTILEYSYNLSAEEIKKINDYVKDNVVKNIGNYKIIMVDNQEAGCLLLSNYEDGKLLDEIYLEEKYRNMGIGTDIISDILKRHNVVYLWVYKNNEKALKLYKRLGFCVVLKTETRFLMKNGG